jgi:hypothetical protein
LIQALYEREGQKTICLVDEHATLVGLMRAYCIEDATPAMGRHLDHLEQSLDYDRHSGLTSGCYRRFFKRSRP